MKLLLENEKVPEDIAKFYLAELVLAVESVHSQGLIHKDLRPEQIVIGSDGHLQLVDYGLKEHVQVDYVNNSMFLKSDQNRLMSDNLQELNDFLNDTEYIKENRATRAQYKRDLEF